MKDNEMIVPEPVMALDNKQYRQMVSEMEVYAKTLPMFISGDELPLEHSFAEGLYIRTLLIPKGHFCIGKLHYDSYVNFFVEGDMTIFTEGGVKRVGGPSMIVSPAGTKRFGYAHSNVVWVTVHPNPTEERNIKALDSIIHAPRYDDIPPIDPDEVSEETKNSLAFLIAGIRYAEKSKSNIKGKLCQE